MKLTWFGGSTLRIHIGGRILVAEPAALTGVDADELVSGADQVFALDGLSPVDAVHWQPRRQTTMLDESGPSEVHVHGLAARSVLVDAVGEPPLLLLGEPLHGAGRWSRDAVVVAFAADVAAAALDTLEPRLIALAMAETQADAVFGQLRNRLGGTAVVALEPRMALEI